MLKKLNLDDDVFYIGLCDFRDIEKLLMPIVLNIGTTMLLNLIKHQGY
jgi:hypothetical protein